MDLAKLIDAGKEFGFSGSELQEFVKKQQDNERDARAEILEIKKIESETAAVNLKIAQSHEKLSSQKQVSTNGNEGHRSSARAPKLPAFNEERDDLDAYLHRYERYASSQGWSDQDLAINLSALLTGNALEVYSRLPNDQANDYAALKSALLKRFQLTADCFRNKFLTGKPQKGETAHQYTARLESYLNRWIDLSNTNHTYNDLKDLFLREQILESCPRDLALFVKERKPADVTATSTIAEQYLEARGGIFNSPRQPDPRPPSGPIGSSPNESDQQAGKESHHPPPPRGQSSKQCFLCHKQGHLAKDCNTRFASRPPPSCFVCRKYGHLAKDCRHNPQNAAGLMTSEDYPTAPSPLVNPFATNSIPPERFTPFLNENSTPQFESGLQPHEPSNVHNATNNPVTTEASCMLVTTHSLPHECCVKDNRVQLQCGHSLPVLSAACSEEVVEKMPGTTGFVGRNRVSVLRDSGCSSAVIKEDLVDASQMTGKYKGCVLIDGTVKQFPVANIHVNTPFFSGMTEALCMEAPLFDLILGNIAGVRAPNDPDPNWTAPIHPGVPLYTQTHTKQSNHSKPLNIPPGLGAGVTPEILQKAQQDDASLNRVSKLGRDQTEWVSQNQAVSSFHYKDGILFRKFHSPAVESNKVFTQVVVPTPYRLQVIQAAHETTDGEHPGVKRTLYTILTTFYWPGIFADVANYCRSCEVCQRASAPGQLTSIPPRHRFMTWSYDRSYPDRVNYFSMHHRNGYASHQSEFIAPPMTQRRYDTY